MKTIAIASLAGLAAVASAGSTASVSFAADRSVANLGETITWTVSIGMSGFDSGSAYVGGFVGDFLANDAGLAVAAFPQSFMAGNATAPEAGVDGNVRNINIFNSALLGSDDQTNPLVVFQFEALALDLGELSYAADGVVSIFGSDFIFETPVEFDGLASSSSDRVSIVPTPAAAALLGFGGLATARRRR